MIMSLPKIFQRKTILLVIFLFLLSLSFAKAAQAKYLPRPGGVTSPTAPLDQYREALEAEEMNLEQFTRFSVDHLSEAGTQALMGVPVLEGQIQGGAFGGVISLTANLYNNPPASSVEYLADIGRNLGLASPAYAQGLGWRALHPILEIWKICRDVAYLFLVIVFIIVGFMIMFRAKIDPQTVASIQNALPQLVIALILITFSYALAGLMFDLMEFGMALITALIKPRLVMGTPADFANSLSIFRLINDSFGGVINLENIEIPGEGLMAFVVAIQDIMKIFHAGSAVFHFVFSIVVVFTAFKLFFALLSRYITFILAAIFAPLLLLFSAIPGRGDLVWMWLKTLLKAVLAFPAVYALLAIAAIISNAPEWGVKISTEGLGTPRMLGDVFATDRTLIKNIIGLGIFLVSPTIPGMIDQIFERKPGPPAFAEAAQTLRGVIARLPIVGGFAGV
jgi:hypothetical protein